MRKPKRYLVLNMRTVRNEIWARSGDTVYEFMGHDYGLSSEDTRHSGIEHISVTFDVAGKGSSFTIPLGFLKEIPDA